MRSAGTTLVSNCSEAVCFKTWFCWPNPKHRWAQLKSFWSVPWLGLPRVLPFMSSSELEETFLCSKLVRKFGWGCSPPIKQAPTTHPHMNIWKEMGDFTKDSRRRVYKCVLAHAGPSAPPAVRVKSGFTSCSVSSMHTQANSGFGMQTGFQEDGLEWHCSLLPVLESLEDQLLFRPPDLSAAQTWWESSSSVASKVKADQSLWTSLVLKRYIW